jgi:lipid-A-disaccharide synthase
VDHLLALYAFDAPWFEREGLPTTVVGSQALYVDMGGADPAAFRASRGIAAGAPLLVVLPGSRPSEIRLMTPVYEAAIARLKTEHGIYMASSGRINIAGFLGNDVERFVAAIKAVA